MKDKQNIDILMEAIMMVEPKELRRVILNAFGAYIGELKKINNEAIELLK